jgi:hypothetical protein
VLSEKLPVVIGVAKMAGRHGMGDRHRPGALRGVAEARLLLILEQLNG